MPKDKLVYLNVSCSTGERIKDLISRMTIEEKVAQLCAVEIAELLENGKFSQEKAKRLLGKSIGQITRIAGGVKGMEPATAAKLSNQIQKFLARKTRLGIPAMVHEECLSGFLSNRATTFPQAINLASSWNPQTVYDVTSVIRRQMRTTGAHQGLSPVLDVVRDPRWGRLEETMGEDPYLVACMTKAYIEGLQGEDIKKGIIATLKHFAGHGFSEGGRNCAPVNATPRELRETFLFPFEVGIKLAKAGSLMNAYHSIDGVPCTSSRQLLTKILREEWGFEGFVVSDYDSINQIMTLHNVAESKEEAAKLALEAGLEIELPKTDCYGKPLLDALEKGMVSQSTIDQAVTRILKAKFESGIFEQRYIKEGGVTKSFDTPADRKVALRAACESMTLLKNEKGVLPLNKKTKTVAVIGPNAADTKNLIGDYGYTVHLSMETDSVRTVSILEGIKNAVSPDTEILYAQGCDYMGSNKDGFEEAVDAAGRADVAVVVVGGRSRCGTSDGTSGEGRDRIDLNLLGVQEDLVREICGTGKPVVLVIADGKPLTISGIVNDVAAILHAWLPGEEGGNAVAQVLFGDFNPSGRLPVSIPKTVGQIPVHYCRRSSSFKDYISMDAKPLFPFGHGLSYTDFKYSDLKINPARGSSAGKVSISLDVQNSGKCRGDEVVQLYIRDVVASISRPVKELKGFKKLSLAPQEKRSISFTVSSDQLAFYDENMKLTVEPGTFEVMVGSSSEDIRLSGKFDVTGAKREVIGDRDYLTEIEVK